MTQGLFLKNLLTKNNFEVMTANNGQEALQMLETFIPRLFWQIGQCQLWMDWNYVIKLRAMKRTK